jgi:hypothetical protein
MNTINMTSQEGESGACQEGERGTCRVKRGRGADDETLEIIRRQADTIIKLAEIRRLSLVDKKAEAVCACAENVFLFLIRLQVQFSG